MRRVTTHLPVGDGRLRCDVDQGLRDEAALVGLDKRIARDDRRRLLHLHVHVHPLEARLHAERAADRHAADLRAEAKM